MQSAAKRSGLAVKSPLPQPSMEVPHLYVAFVFLLAIRLKKKMERFIGFRGLWVPLGLPLCLLLLDCCGDGFLHCRRRLRTRYG